MENNRINYLCDFCKDIFRKAPKTVRTRRISTAGLTEQEANNYEIVVKVIGVPSALTVVSVGTVFS